MTQASRVQTRQGPRRPSRSFSEPLQAAPVDGSQLGLVGSPRQAPARRTHPPGVLPSDGPWPWESYLEVRGQSGDTLTLACLLGGLQVTRGVSGSIWEAHHRVRSRGCVSHGAAGVRPIQTTRPTGPERDQAEPDDGKGAGNAGDPPHGFIVPAWAQKWAVESAGTVETRLIGQHERRGCPCRYCPGARGRIVAAFLMVPTSMTSHPQRSTTLT
jgi:hypothetical protein